MELHRGIIIKQKKQKVITINGVTQENILYKKITFDWALHRKLLNDTLSTGYHRKLENHNLLKMQNYHLYKKFKN